MDETPGAALYTSYYADGPDDCDVAYGTDMNSYELSYVEGAEMINLYPLCHQDFRDDPMALDAILDSLQGNTGNNTAGNDQ